MRAPYCKICGWFLHLFDAELAVLRRLPDSPGRCCTAESKRLRVFRVRQVLQFATFGMHSPKSIAL